ncbi:MAG: FAD-dependent oxidoreductase [Methylocystis sp.]
MRIAIVGTGISALSAAWLLCRSHDVVVFEAADRLGGHSNTVDAPLPDGRSTPVDTGFIVYNEPAYPNLTALFGHLSIATYPTEMSFSVSLGSGALEYAGKGLSGLFAQPRNLVSPRFWSMLGDLRRFYAEAPRDLPQMGNVTLGDYLDAHGYGPAFRQDHLYPMAAAIWSMPARQAAAYPVAAFVRFCQNHGLLQVRGRPVWRTVVGGARAYVAAVSAPFADRIRLRAPVSRIERESDAVNVVWPGGSERFDAVVIGAHADQALAMLAHPSDDERRVLARLRYGRNIALLHSDERLMPRRRAIWSSWNYLARNRDANAPLSVTYWMNRLQRLPQGREFFVTLNPIREPREELTHKRLVYEHPIFDSAALSAQKELWSLQGRDRVWFCGAYFGAGFHEDGLQAGLAVAEQLGGVRRPWRVAEESGRIQISAAAFAAGAL